MTNADRYGRFISKIYYKNKFLSEELIKTVGVGTKKKLDITRICPYRLENVLAEEVATYNTIRPQLSVQDNTPKVMFLAKPLNINHYKIHFTRTKTVRITHSQENRSYNAIYKKKAKPKPR